MMTAWDMWNHWNKALHKQEDNKQDILEAVVNQKIQDMYSQGTSGLLLDAHALMKQSLA